MKERLRVSKTRCFAKDDKGLIVTNRKIFRYKRCFWCRTLREKGRQRKSENNLEKNKPGYNNCRRAVQATDVFTGKDKVARIWISDKYSWNLLAHPYEIKHPLLGISMIFCVG